jgi:hypothetical protein
MQSGGCSEEFEQLWCKVLSECELEFIPRARLRVLAAMTTDDDLRYLLSESDRIGCEWEAIGETDVSDGYWRMSTCAAETFALIPRSAALSRRRGSQLRFTLLGRCSPATAVDGVQAHAEGLVAALEVAVATTAPPA